ncbi:MAG: 4Fe-4S binding protein [Candidatus Lokiarchaeota archaeon]|nr:4Fe-4S binding protein [Candidatus Lokiarchaeota archaeon]
MSEAEYQKALKILFKSGGFQFPFSETIHEILKITIKDENLDFMMAFENQKSQTMEQLKESSGLSEEEILKKADALAKMGVIINQPNTQGVMVYQMFPFHRQFEYIFMKNLEKTEENYKLAKLFYKLNEEHSDIVQSQYDGYSAALNRMPPMDRTVPILENLETGEEINIIVNEELEVPKEKILPAQKIRELIEKYDDIAVGNCYCRQHQEFLDNPCKMIDLIPSCMTLGKSARHTSNHGFSKLVSKEEALEILKKCEDAGLVHKAYHKYGNSSAEEVAICNCCNCCCMTARDCLIFPVVNETNYLAEIDEDLCIGCGTCVDLCYNKAISLNDDDKAERIEEFCAGCGVCAYHCSENAISLVEGPRMVRMLPPRKN